MRERTAFDFKHCRQGESIDDIDATALITLREFQKQLATEQIELRFARINTHVM